MRGAGLRGMRVGLGSVMVPVGMSLPRISKICMGNFTRLGFRAGRSTKRWPPNDCSLDTYNALNPLDCRMSVICWLLDWLSDEQMVFL